MGTPTEPDAASLGRALDHLARTTRPIGGITAVLGIGLAVAAIAIGVDGAGAVTAMRRARRFQTAAILGAAGLSFVGAGACLRASGRRVAGRRADGAGVAQALRVGLVGAVLLLLPILATAGALLVTGALAGRVAIPFGLVGALYPALLWSEHFWLLRRVRTEGAGPAASPPA